jgi:hypothetical protein
MTIGLTELDTSLDIPDDYRANFEVVAPYFTQKIASTQLPGESWIDTATKLLTAVTMTQQQRSLMQLNIERARQGQPPIDINAYTGVGVNVGLSQSTQQLVMYGGLAFLAYLVFNSLNKR